jgi:thiol:disulfide interchange protein
VIATGLILLNSQSTHRAPRVFAATLASFAFLMSLVPLLPHSAWAQPVERPHIVVELLSEHESMQPGTMAPLGIRFTPEPGWHVYWRNPGDSGLPPQIKWNTPTGFVASDIAWPHPEVVSTPPFVTYGYHGDALLLTDIAVPVGAATGADVTLAATASWLVCQADACVPGKADLALTIGVETGRPLPDSRWIDDFASARRNLPQTLAGWTTRAWNEGDQVIVELVAPSDADPLLTNVAVFPLEQAVLNHAAKQRTERDGRTLRLHLQRSDDRTGPLEELHAVLVADQAWDFEDATHAVTLRTDVALEPAAAIARTVESKPTTLPNSASAAATVATSVATSVANTDPPPALGATTSGTTLLGALLLAFVGGLILNLMPCVFPVLSLKILGFVQSAHHDPASIRRHGHAFAVGVIVSFVALAGLLLLLREGGRELGWGFQLQSPAFVALMVLVVFSMGLNLLGVFEIGTSLTTAAGRFDSHSGYRGSFLSGALATVLATPCTAPFMGTALGFALAQPAGTALAVFAMLGVGMSAPYVLLSYQPALLARLPRPGAWMITFKQAMAFPLFATAVWLLWVFGQQVGNDAVMQLLAALVFLGFGVWLVGHFEMTNLAGPARVLARAGTTVAICAGLYLGISAANLPVSSTACAAECSPGTATAGHSWIPYDEARLAELRTAGVPVFVDFTAAWCLSCKVNERVALGSDKVWAKFAEQGVVTMKADWTNGDPVITRALANFGRSSVPFYILYHGAEGTEPILLPEIITPTIVLDALARTEVQPT